MNLGLTEPQRRIRQMVREFAAREVAPPAAEIDRTDEFPSDLYKRMAEFEILGMTTEFPIERRHRGARVYQIWEGTSRISVSSSRASSSIERIRGCP